MQREVSPRNSAPVLPGVFKKDRVKERIWDMGYGIWDMERTKETRGKTEERDIKISKALHEFFRDQGKIGMDMKSLYEHYLYTAQWQGTDQLYSVNSYCIKALHWGKARLLSANKTLINSN